MKTHQVQLEFIPPETNSPKELMASYLRWKEQLEPLTPTIESRRNSQSYPSLEGSSSSHNWEAAYTGPDTSGIPPDRVITMSPLLYEWMLKEEHVSELLQLQIRIRRESWLHYLGRIIRHLLRIDQLP